MSTPERVQVSINFATINAGTSEVWETCIPLPGVWQCEAAYFVPMTNRTAHATNNTDISMNIGTTEIASEVTSVADTGNLTAGTPLVLALTGTGAQLEASQAERITFKKTDGGTGLALDGTFVASFVKIRGA